MTKKIYRITICGSADSCNEFWENIPLTQFYESRERAEEKLKEFEELTQEALEDLEVVWSWGGIHGVYVGSNRPVIDEYELITED